MSECPCCSSTLLKHWKKNQTYWYCSTCRQEMPNLELTKMVAQYQQKSRIAIEQLSSRKPILSSFNEAKAS